MTEHVLLTSEECQHTDSEDRDRCPVCSWGASICKVCNAVEAELKDYKTCEEYWESQDIGKIKKKRDKDDSRAI